MWWYIAVALATQEAKMGGLLVPGGQRLQCAVIVPLYFSLDNVARPCLKQTKTIFLKDSK